MAQPAARKKGITKEKIGEIKRVGERHVTGEMKQRVFQRYGYSGMTGYLGMMTVSAGRGKGVTKSAHRHCEIGPYQAKAWRSR
jgi:hypothetical protein